MLAVISHRLIGFKFLVIKYISYKKKYERILIHFEAVGNAHNTDKSRPYTIWTFADLLLVSFKNFLHFEMSNKSQTRKYNMSPLFKAVGANYLTKDGAKIQLFFDICKRNGDFLRKIGHFMPE